MQLTQSFRRMLLGAVFLSGIAPCLGYYGATTNFTTWFNITEYPDEQTANVSTYLFEALQTAGDDLYSFFAHRCIQGQAYPELSDLSQADGFVEPTRAFDSVFFIGSSYVSSWIVDTGAGLVLIDTQDNPDEAARIVVPGLEYLGYSTSDIAAVIITHEHADHYGGARYLQDTYDLPVYASAAAWDGMANDSIAPAGLVPPRRNLTIADGQDLTVGNTTLHFVLTPGHTPGTLSFFFDVYDAGARHVAAVYGGGGVPSAADAKADQIASFGKFAEQAEARGADALIAPHQTQDNALYNFDLLRHRPYYTGGSTPANPFVLGNDAYLRYLKTMAFCVRIQAARLGQDLSI
ncbi:beta-lactamase-like protein [Pestalotiopsis sp. NC0098]|nr:beta-lactamase-like protein [Pestalotiopsis sp. NC0098]